MRTETGVLYLALAGLVCSPGPVARAASQGAFRVADDLTKPALKGSYRFYDKPDQDKSIGSIRLNAFGLPDRPKQPYRVRLFKSRSKPGDLEWFAEPDAARWVALFGVIKLKRGEEGSAKRSGTFSYQFEYRPVPDSPGDWDWFPLPETPEMLCVFEPDGEQPAQFGDSYYITMEGTDEKGQNGRYFALLDRSDDGWKFDDRGSFPLYRKKQTCTVNPSPGGSIRITVKGAPAGTLSVTGKFSDDGRTMGGTFFYTDTQTTIDKTGDKDKQYTTTRRVSGTWEGVVRDRPPGL